MVSVLHNNKPGIRRYHCLGILDIIGIGIPRFCRVVDCRMGQISLPATLIIVTFTSRGLPTTLCLWRNGLCVVGDAQLLRRLAHTSAACLARPCVIRGMFASGRESADLALCPQESVLLSTPRHRELTSLQAVCQLARGAMNVTARNW